MRIYGSSADIVLAHRDKLTAGVPGCTCGKSYPEDSHGYAAVLHAQHVAEELVTHVLTATVASIRIDLEDFARNPDRWSAGGHDSMAAIDAITTMARHESEQTREKEPTA